MNIQDFSLNKIIIVIGFLLLSFQSTYGIDKIVLINSQESYHLNWPQVYEDKTNKLTIQDITSKEKPIIFKKSPFKNPNYGYKLSSFWTTFTIENETSKQKDWILEIDYTLLDNIDLYIKQDDGSFLVKHAGRTFPFKKNEINGRNFGFKLKLEPGQKQTYFIRIKSQDTSAFPIIIRTPDNYNRSKSQTLFLFGLYYGILLVMIAYNGFIYLSLKDISYAYYVGYCFGYGLFQLLFNGLAFEFIWPFWPSLNIALFPFSIAFAQLGATKFIQSFLHTKKYTPKLNSFLNIFFIIYSICCVISFIVPYIITIYIVTVLTLFFGILAIITSIASWRAGYSPARFFIIAWSLLLFGIIILSLKCAGLVPINFITIYGIQIGSVLDLSLLAFALADRISLITAEKSQKEKELASLHKELELAKKIQESILPRKLPIVHGLSVYAKYLPMEQIGGDYYDFLTVKEGHFINIIADVSGHGLPAAMVASMAKLAFIMDARISNSPAHILTSMNDNLYDQFKGKYLTALAINIDINNKKLQLANAGHLPLIIVRNSHTPSAEGCHPPLEGTNRETRDDRFAATRDENSNLASDHCHPRENGDPETDCTSLKLDPLVKQEDDSLDQHLLDFAGYCEIIELTTDGGSPIGWYKENDIEETEIELQSGDRILLYTDCILEAKNQANIQFEKENFHNFIKENCNTDPKEFASKLINKLVVWTGTPILDDDFTIVIIDFL